MKDYAGYLTIGAEIQTKEFDAQIDYIEEQMKEIEYQLKRADMGFEVGDTLKLERQYEKLGNQLIDLKKNQDDYNRSIREAESSGLNNIKEQLSKIGKSVESVTAKVGRWAIAIIGVRSAYNFVRQSVGLLAQHNEKLATDLQYIKYALASSLEPIITRIVQWVYTLLQYLGYIIKQWTGKNIFANANKGLEKANKKAKDLQKTLQQTAFDEMNILQDNKKNQEKTTAPSVDLSKISDDQPGWVKWIGKNGKTMLAILSGIVSFLTAIKFGIKGIKALGIGVAVAGIVTTIQNLLAYLKDPSWENFGGILEGLGIAIVGIGILFGNWPMAIAGAIVLILGILAKFWDKIKKFFENLLDGIDEFGENAEKFLTEKLGIIGTIIGKAFKYVLSIAKELVRSVMHIFDGLFTGVKKILDGIIDIFKGNFKEGIVKILKGIANILIGVINFLIDGLNTVIAPIRALVVVVGKIMGKNWTMDDIRIPNIPTLARGGIVHNPGSGVLMGNYIAGEGNDPEAVIPLNDETLDRLGERIARHMNINANITNTMNGRVISRELYKINNENNFAYNS